ncbi:MAG: isoprenylcysteine carboxylmethyltransferase family protein, partial [Chloroflexota bacterium]
MKKLTISIYGVICYVLFLIVFLYFVAFMNNLFVPKTISSGTTDNAALSVLINIGLITLFGMAHSVMARDSFKKQWTKIVPQAAERSTYVLQASLLLALIMWQWRP